MRDLSAELRVAQAQADGFEMLYRRADDHRRVVQMAALFLRENLAINKAIGRHYRKAQKGAKSWKRN